MALASIQSQKVDETNKIRRLTTIYHNIGKLLSNYFHFQAEYGYWKESLLSLNAELETRIRQRTKQLEETVRDLNSAQQLLKSQNEELRRNAEIQSGAMCMFTLFGITERIAASLLLYNCLSCRW